MQTKEGTTKAGPAVAKLEQSSTCTVQDQPKAGAEQAGDFTALKCMTVTYHNKMEWARMAQDMYWHGINYLGHRYSAAAAIPEGTRLTCADFDALHDLYRTWLIDGAQAFPTIGDIVESAISAKATGGAQ